MESKTNKQIHLMDKENRLVVVGREIWVRGGGAKGEKKKVTLMHYQAAITTQK